MSAEIVLSSGGLMEVRNGQTVQVEDNIGRTVLVDLVGGEMASGDADIRVVLTAGDCAVIAADPEGQVVAAEGAVFGCRVRMDGAAG